MAYLVDLQPSDQFEPDGLNSEEREALSVLAQIALGTVPLAFVKTRLSDKDADLVDKIARIDLTPDETKLLEEVATVNARDTKSIKDLFGI